MYTAAFNSGDNASHIYREMQLDCREVIQHNVELPIRVFNREIKNMPSAGCTPCDLAAYIRRELLK